MITKEETDLFAENLQDLIRCYSEETWCAGWMNNVEHEIWDKINEPQFAVMRMLSIHINGWVDYDGFVPMKEWLKRHDEWKPLQTHSGD